VFQPLEYLVTTSYSGFDPLLLDRSRGFTASLLEWGFVPLEGLGLCCFSPYLFISFSLVILGFIRSLVLREFPVGEGELTPRNALGNKERVKEYR